MTVLNYITCNASYMQIYDKNTTSLTPDSWVFGIWGGIFALQALALAHLLNRKNESLVVRIQVQSLPLVLCTPTISASAVSCCAIFCLSRWCENIVELVCKRWLNAAMASAE